MKTRETKVHIVSYSDRPFANRRQAAHELAAELGRYRDKDTVVLGIPRGGMIIAVEMARALGCAFDIALARKLGAPGNPELAIGAVGEDGMTFINRPLLAEFGIPAVFIEREKEQELAEIRRRAALYRQVLPRAKVAGRTVILTDDGLATGATMQAALRTLRREGPKTIVAAVPVAPRDSLMEIGMLADETVCLRVPEYFGALGQFYEDFAQVGDQELLDLIRAARRGTVTGNDDATGR